MNCLLKKYNCFLLTLLVVFSLASCKKGGEPVPMFDQSEIISDDFGDRQDIESVDDKDDSIGGDKGGGKIVGGDDDEDDDGGTAGGGDEDPSGGVVKGDGNVGNGGGELLDGSGPVKRI